ncbi:hypothetical protein BD626DRAFT_557808 [Schizophyllum amplum]|uniref:Uncharacterized protein n=1 Tax=Schizophyllum amplum TaxID=97359 RepID=A0A550CDP2_9AGAR|nr:hypothetical protein BD626DRAFT_557808 [Auriculariopsis ampla]
MSMHHPREQLPRLNIAPSLQMQQPMSFPQGQMFSPALPTSLQQSFHPPFPMNHPNMHTPMQQHFGYPMPPPSAPGRPSHHAAAASIAHLAAMGIHPPNGGPPIITPVGGHFPRGSVMLGPPGMPGMPPPFGHKRRNMSIGGPPKAVLGGPQRKTSPLPPAAASTSAPVTKAKKIAVNLPKETIPGEDGAPPMRPEWARAPLDAPFECEDVRVPSAELSSAALFPPDAYRYAMPPTIDVFLPGKSNWDKLKQMAIEEKLQKLGVERGSGSNVPHIYAPHARAASISSPADPALLLFKLNKLQQAQASSATSSPQPSFTTPSPNQAASVPAFGLRHGHSMSLSQPPTHTLNKGFNPFGPTATLGSDHISTLSETGPQAESANVILAPQGLVPVQASKLAPPPLSAASRPPSKPDFLRGFGIDIPEEAEEEEEAEREFAKDVSEDVQHSVNGTLGGAEYSGASTEVDVKEEHDHEEDDVVRDAPTIVAQSRHHSRHVSRLSAALSLRSVGGVAADGLQDRSGHNGDASQDMDVDDAIAEWTGSEDLYNGMESSDDESIGEWSNPSDEERARQQRAERRVRRKAARQRDAEQPRRLPNFPRPPDNTLAIARPPIDDDIVSNPSDEEGPAKHYLGVDYYEHPGSEYGGSQARPLPPIPHSRGPSNHLSVHDPANAHSRHASIEHFQQSHSQNPSMHSNARRELNPFAKPFVFGAPAAPPWGSEGLALGVPAPPNAPFMGHTPLPSVGAASQASRRESFELKPAKKLNVGAPEFKPTFNIAAPEFKPMGFTFRPPVGAPPPQTFTAPAELPRPLPVPPAPVETEVVAVAQGGPSKRQRRQSTGSIEEGDSIMSFRFPTNLESPMSIRHHNKSPSITRHSLDHGIEPLTFAAFSTAAAAMPHIPTAESLTLANDEEVQEHLNRLTEEEIIRPGSIQEQFKNFSFPHSASKTKRAPIPLDFKHPVSKNTVPAGLFKALGDERTRKSVRSRLSSRDVFEHENRPSLDDLNVPPISRKVSRTRLVTDPGNRPTSISSAEDDVFTSARRHTRRRSSLPDALHDRSGSQSPEPSISSRISSPAMDLTSRLEMHRYEDRVEAMLDDKLTLIRREIARTNGAAAAADMEAKIDEMMSLFRQHLSDAATKSMMDSQMDARGEFDFEMLKDAVQEGHQESLRIMQQELSSLTQSLAQVQVSGGAAQDLGPLLQRLNANTVQVVNQAIARIPSEVEALHNSSVMHARKGAADDIVSALKPMLDSLHREPVDYDLLTNQLTQAVKPHIAQLIDLASDKRETAGLIVDRLVPILPKIAASQPPIDVDALTLQLVTEVRRAIAPIDAFEIKEQVADLVVERLDSRLATRDKHMDGVVGKVREIIASSLAPVSQVTSTLTALEEGQRLLSTKQTDFTASQKHANELVSQLPQQLKAAMDAFGSTVRELQAKSDIRADPVLPDENLLAIKATLEKIEASASSNVSKEQVLAQQREFAEKLNALPESFAAATNVLQAAHAEFALTREQNRREMDDLRKAVTEAQVQVAKARGAHGQVRVEKDVLSEKLGVMEADRNRLQEQVKTLQSSATIKVSEATAMEARNKELEDALAKALARLQTSDVAATADKDRIAQLEKANRDLEAEKQTMQKQLNKLETKSALAVRDKETANASAKALQKRLDEAQSHDEHWDNLRRACEQMSEMSSLVGQTDNKELAELREVRDRAKVLEGEHAALKRRFKEQDGKMANAEKIAFTARQSLNQAQQRASEWERRAKEYEASLELTRTKLEHAEQTHAQLDADHSVVRLQLEEREANDRLAKDLENKQRDTITALENKVRLLQTQLERAVTGTVQAKTNGVNGSAHTIHRPSSRASTVYADSRAATPTLSHAPSPTPARASVYAPVPSRYPGVGQGTPKGRSYKNYRSSIPSPTPSVMSVVTQGEDGWWS